LDTAFVPVSCRVVHSRDVRGRFGDTVGDVPRIRRSELPDGIFHVTTRGVFRRLVYLDDDDRRLFLALLALVVRRHRWECHAFCLMGTHYHLVLETTTERLSPGMQYLNGTYAQRFNRRHDRDGHVFGARFASWVIRDDVHYERTMEYVLTNPVRAGLVDDWTDWEWSGARGFASVARASADPLPNTRSLARLPRWPLTPS
jgi:putative transposase